MSENNLWRKFEAFIRPVIIVLIFILFLGVGFFKEAKADVGIEIGGGMLSGEYSGGTSLIIEERFNSRYALGIGYVTKQEVTDRSGTTYKLQENLWVQGTRYVNIYKGWDLSLGVAYHNGTNRALGSNFTAALGVHYEWEHLYVNFRHYSNAGSASPNMGQDLFTIGWRF